ncbi:MAG: DUF2272 domain-containing protein [Devosia sp.]
MTVFSDQLAATARAERARWVGGAEDQAPWRDYVGQYWQSIGIDDLRGDTVVDGIRPAWSSAFVSFCVRKAGAGTRFRYSEALCHYVKAAMDAASGTGNHGFAARKYETYRPRVGDIIVGGREYAKAFSYEQAAMVYVADSFYPSHGDIVVGIAPDHSYVETLGGNVSQDVSGKRLALKADGTLEKRKSGTATYPWIAVLECLL